MPKIIDKSKSKGGALLKLTETVPVDPEEKIVHFVIVEKENAHEENTFFISVLQSTLEGAALLSS